MVAAVISHGQESSITQEQKDELRHNLDFAMKEFGMSALVYCTTIPESEAVQALETLRTKARELNMMADACYRLGAYTEEERKTMEDLISRIINNIAADRETMMELKRQWEGR